MQSTMTLKKSPNEGFSLIELLLAMALGLIVLAALITVFSGTKRLNSTITTLSELQEKSRSLIEYLNNEVRLAGFNSVSLSRGLDRNITSHLTGLPSNTLFNKQPGVSGYAYQPSQSSIVVSSNNPTVATAGSFQPALASELANATIKPVQGSDVVVIRYTYPITNIKFDNSNVVTQHDLKTTVGATGINLTNMLLLADRRIEKQSDIFINKGNNTVIKGSSRTSSPYWSADYNADAHLYQYRIIAFYVGNNPLNNRPSLYSLEFGQTPQLIVSGVTSLQARYRINSSGKYLTANQVTDWRYVDAVEMSLLLQSSQKSGQATTQSLPIYTGRTLNIDKSPYLHKLYRSTITIRNHLHTL